MFCQWYNTPIRTFRVQTRWISEKLNQIIQASLSSKVKIWDNNFSVVHAKIYLFQILSIDDAHLEA